MTVTAGSERASFSAGTGTDDVIFFVLQAGTDAVTQLTNTGNTSNVDRFDGSFTTNEFANRANAVLDANDNALTTRRPLEAIGNVTALTAVPEPTTVFAGVAGLGLLGLRRRGG